MTFLRSFLFKIKNHAIKIDETKLDNETTNNRKREAFNNPCKYSGTTPTTIVINRQRK